LDFRVGIFIFIRKKHWIMVNRTTSGSNLSPVIKKTQTARERPPLQHCIKKKLLGRKPRNTPKAGCPGRATECPHASLHLAENDSCGYTYNTGSQLARGVFFNPGLPKNHFHRETNLGPGVLEPC